MGRFSELHEQEKQGRFSQLRAAETPAVRPSAEEQQYRDLLKKDGLSPEAIDKEIPKLLAAKKLPMKLEDVGENITSDAARATNMVRGATFGFDDEAAGLGAGLGALSGGDAFLPAYREGRDERRDVRDLAREKGTVKDILIGGAATAGLGPAVNSLKAAAGTGAAFGAVGGLGNSDADLTKGEVGGAALDTGLGAGLGAGLGSTFYGLSKGLSYLFRPGVEKAADALGAEAGIPNAAAQDLVKTAEAAGQDIPATALGGLTSKAPFSLRTLFRGSPKADVVARNTELGLEKAAMDSRAAALVPEVEASLADGIQSANRAAGGRVSDAIQNVGRAKEAVIPVREAASKARDGVNAATNAAEEQWAAKEAGDLLLKQKARHERYQQALEQGIPAREMPRTGREVIPAPEKTVAQATRDARTAAAGAKDNVSRAKDNVMRAQNSLASERDAARQVAGQGRDLKSLFGSDSVAREQARNAGNNAVLTAQRSRLLEKNVPGSFSQKAIDQLTRDADDHASQLLALDKLMKAASTGRQAIGKAEPGAPGGISDRAIEAVKRLLADKGALAKYASDPAKTRELVEQLASGQRSTSEFSLDSIARVLGGFGFAVDRK